MMKARWGSLAGFVIGVALTLFCCHPSFRVVGRAGATEVKEVPSTATDRPNDVVYDESWEATEFLGVKKSYLESMVGLDSVGARLVGSVAAAAAGIPATALMISNSVPLHLFKREDIVEGVLPNAPLNKAVTGWMGVAFPGPMVFYGPATFGMPTVTRWRVTGHIHSAK